MRVDVANMSASELAVAGVETTGFDVGVVDRSLTWCLAIRLANDLWRNGPLEDGVTKPGGITNAEMTRANIATPA